MPNVIQSLLVGIGFTVDKKSTQNVEGAIDGVKDKALQVTGLIAGAFGANALTAGFAATFDSLGKFSERWGVAADDVNAFDQALQHAGGTAGEIRGSIENLSKLQRQSAQQKAGFLAGVAPEGIADQVESVINASNAIDGFVIAADALQQLDPARQERFIQALGFSNAEVLLLQEGSKGILAAVAAEKERRPVTEQATKTAAKFNDELQRTNDIAGGFSDKIAVPLTGSIANIVAGMNDWAEVNKEAIDPLVELAGETVAENIDLIAIALGSLAAGATISGLRVVAGLVAGISGSMIAGAAAAAPFVAGAAVLTMGGKGEPLSAGGVFGENAITNFLDTPIGELFGGSESVATPGLLQAAGNLPGVNPVQVTIPIILDGQTIETKVVDVINEQSEQAIQDLTVSEGG